MTSDKQSKDSTKCYYGWVMVFVTGLQRFYSGPGQTYSIQNWKPDYIEEFSLTESQMGTLYAAATTASGCLLFTMGMAVDKWGTRNMTLWAALPGLTLACFVSSQMTNYWMVWFSIFLLRFFGQGAMSMIPSVCVAHWFTKKRGRAFSLSGIGGFVSALVLPPMNTVLIETFGWRETWQIWVCLIIGIMFPVALCFYRSKPVDMGLEGEPDEQDENEDGSYARAAPVEVSWTMNEVIRTPAFWVLIFVGTEMAAVITALTFYIRDIGAVSGITELQSASLLSISAMIGFPVTVTTGFMLEKFQANVILALSFFF